MPNLWNSDGSFAGGEEAEARVQEQLDYMPQLRWKPEYKGHGYRGVPITPAEDFAEPYRTIEEELEELI